MPEAENFDPIQLEQIDEILFPSNSSINIELIFKYLIFSFQFCIFRMLEIVELPELDSFSKSLLYLAWSKNLAYHLFITVFITE